MWGLGSSYFLNLRDSPSGSMPISKPEKKKMASFFRSAIMAGSRSLAYRSKTLNLKSLNPKPISSPFSSPSTRALPRASRYFFWGFIHLNLVSNSKFIFNFKGLFRCWKEQSRWCHFIVPLHLLGYNQSSLWIPHVGAGSLKVFSFSILYFFFLFLFQLSNISLVTLRLVNLICSSFFATIGWELL